MALEIERKFLVTGVGWRTDDGQRIVQGYLNRDKARTVRVRIAGNDAFLTIKGVSIGATRVEFEYPVPLADAEAMLALCDGPLIDKVRRRVPFGGLIWEVDEFAGDNAGLVVAEVELSCEDQAFDLPPWVGEEVTHDARYFNSNLAIRPYSRWTR
ncbi:MAG: CYTH domain-containing protein [Hydrogenophaga sp.]|nr:CYTH domain-containing protein [Hydrogenophaga sp.]